MCADNFRLDCDEYVKIGDSIWFSAQKHNGLYCMNCNTKETRLVSEFPGEKMMGYRLYKSITRAGDKLFFAPCNASAVAVYDISKQEMRMIAVEDMQSPRKTVFGKGFKFWTAVAYNPWIYFMGHGYPAILRINTVTLKTEYIVEWLPVVNNLADSDNNAPYFVEGCIKGTKALFPLACTDGLAEVDLPTGNVNIICLDSGVDGYNGMAFDGVYFWLTPRNDNRVVRWNGKSKAICVEIGMQKYLPFYSPIIINGYVYLPPILSDKFYKICRKNLEASIVGDMEFIYQMEDHLHVPCGDVVIAPRKTDDGRILLITASDSKWHLVDICHGKREDFMATLDKNGIKRLLQMRFKNAHAWQEESLSELWGEDEENTLEKFLTSDLKKRNQCTINKNFTIGGNIYSVIYFDFEL